MRGFFDTLKTFLPDMHRFYMKFFPEERVADVVRLDILVAEESVPAFARVILQTARPRRSGRRWSRSSMHHCRNSFSSPKYRLKRKDASSPRRRSRRCAKTSRLSLWGDVTRKNKLLDKQKRGKKKMLARGVGRVNIPEEVFMKMVQSSAE